MGLRRRSVVSCLSPVQPMNAPKLTKALEDFASGLTTLSLLGISSQSVWPVPGFVMPSWMLKASFAVAIGAAVIRVMAEKIVNLIIAFRNGNGDQNDSPAQTTAAAP
jgi:hypothetical protein